MSIDIPLSFTIETERCRLRAPMEADLPHVFDATRHAGFNDGMLWDPPNTIDELREPFSRSIESWRHGQGFSFSIDERASDAFLGRIAIRPGVRTKLWSIGFWLHPKHQGRGFMTEAAHAVLRFGFDSLHADEIQADYATWNVASGAVLRAVGMTFVEAIEQGFLKRGHWVPENRMAITRGSRFV